MCTVQVKLELGHRAQLRKKPTTEGFTHDWMVFVRGPEQFEIQHFVERVVFRLHQSFPKPKRVCKEPPYKVEESGYAGFIMPIEVYFKNKEEPKKVCFTYDLFLNLEGNPPVNHLRCEKLTFNNPTKEFRHKLIKAGGEVSKEGGKLSKPHKVTREHRERPRKDSESKGSSRDPEREAGKAAKEPSKKHATENKGPKEEKPLPKAALKEAKLALKEHKLENASPKGAPPAPEGKSSAKRPLTVESPKPMAKKLKKNSSKGAKTVPTNTHRPTNTTTSSSSSYAEKKLPKEKVPSAKAEKPKPESEAKAIKKPVEVTVAEESNSEDEASLKSESAVSSPSNSSSSSDSSSDSDFEPSQNHSQGPLRTMVEHLQSEESDEDDSSSGEEVAVKSTPISREARLSHSDSDTDNSADSCLPSRDTPPRQKGPSANNKVSGRKSPESCNKPEKILKKGTYDKAYTDELVELHRRLMALRERNVLQQIVNLIEETGHFNVTNTTFDFDLFSLDETTVRKLQSYLEAVAT
ncbi:protein ENL isoform X2 [Pantherophis guttatus]|uniref:Protein ENL isoform X2 n=1 Tax=Pantherophis guttatus TaxID=94885 RepID=A0ABM3YWS7_PANGU|nr:protein ENL isoform X2 [Pantherophis guttatus]